MLVGKCKLLGIKKRKNGVEIPFRFCFVVLAIDFAVSKGLFKGSLDSNILCDFARELEKAFGVCEFRDKNG